MKKIVLPFCAVILFATQAPVANASVIEGGKPTTTTINYFQSTPDYKITLKNFFKVVKTTPQKVTINKQVVSINKIKIKTVVNKEESAKVPTKEEAPKATPIKEQEPTTKVPTEAPIKEQEPTKVPTEAPVKEQEPTKVPTETPVKEQAPVVTPVKEQEVKETPSVNDSVLAIEEKVVELTNAERAKHGLPALQIDRAVMSAAREKSQDMKNHNYFSHTSPTFGSPFDRLKALGISYKSAGENIAKGQRTPEEVVQAWMNSAGHRANILSNDFTHIGVGYVESGHIWTQQFIKK